MNRSIERQLSWRLSVAILVCGIGAAILSFLVAYYDANKSQDAELQQVALALARGSYRDVPPETQPEDAEDAESRFLVAAVGDGVEKPRGIALSLPAGLPDGIQTVSEEALAWRVVVLHDTAGERFAVAQSMDARNETALFNAMSVFLPVAALVPILLLAMHAVLRRLFDPLDKLSTEVDQDDGGRLQELRTSDVPLEVLPFIQAVNRLVGRLANLLEQQRRFVADAAHELRTPIAALMVQASNVENAGEIAEMRARVSVLRRSLQRMAAMQDQLLNLAHVQSDTVQSRERLELDALLKSIIEDFLPLAIARGVDLGCPHIQPVSVEGVPRLMSSLMSNAIDNAVRYSPRGGVVDVCLTATDDEVRFIVDDDGPGIAPEQLDRVFEPFVRVLGTKETGSGLGLAIVRAAARSLGGQASLVPRTTGGLRFTYSQSLDPKRP
jgi:two-component system, OmpR family, sensor kinase